jgi:hypothetical protein
MTKGQKFFNYSIQIYPIRGNNNKNLSIFVESKEVIKYS